MTSAVRYDGMGTRCSNVYVLVPSLLACEPVATALIKAVSGPGTVIEAVYGHLTPGESWHGSIDRAWMAWHCVKRYGWFFPAVCSGRSH